MDFKPFKIGKYLLMERLATGGMAEVYRAKASGAGGFEKQLAIKRILPNYSQNEEFQRMFEYEARLSSMLTHANIVQVYDFVKSGETYLLALEYIDGKNLRQFVNKIRKTGYMPPVEFTVWVVNEVCKGLEYAHKKKDDITGRPLNIIHRDMSPQNIMLSYDGAVKIVDFGIAKAKDRVDETRSGVIKGKFGYMSPEQANGQPVDHRTDIFSTAIILWEMLTGKRLFAAENDMATLKLIQECVIPPPSRTNPKVTPELEKLVLKGVTKDLTLRYQSAGSFHRSLQEFLNKYYPAFTQREASDILSRTFQEEMVTEKKRFEQIYRQSIPFSQGAKKEPEEDEGFENMEEALDGSITRSESADVTAVTSEEDLSDSSSMPSEERSAGSTQAGGDRLDRTMASKSLSIGDNTQVESIIGADEFSMPSLNERAGRDRKKNENARSKVDGYLDNSAGSASTLGERTLIKEDRMPAAESTPDNRRGATPSSRYSRPKEDNKSSGIILGSADVMNDTNRRRERSISAISDVGGNTAGGNSSEISLVSMDENPRATRPSPREQSDDDKRVVSGTGGRYYPEREDYRQKRRIPAFMSALLLLGSVVGIGYLYRLYVDQKLPMLIQMIDPRTGASDSKAGGDTETLTVGDTKATRGDCTVQIDSDPAGAAVVIGGSTRGNTSTTISLPCNQTFEYTLQLDGYELAADRLQMKERMGKVYKTLQPIPLGKLELTTDRNAKIYIDDQLAADVKAGEKFEKTLRANKKYRIRFFNEIFNIDVTREFMVLPDRVERQVVRLVEPLRSTNSNSPSRGR